MMSLWFARSGAMQAMGQVPWFDFEEEEDEE